MVATDDLQITLCKFLMHYQSSPHASTVRTPAELNRCLTEIFEPD